MEKKRKAEDKRKRRNERKAEQLLSSATVDENSSEGNESPDADVNKSVESATDAD